MPVLPLYADFVIVVPMKLWSDAPLPQQDEGRRAAPSIPAIQIYVDEECREQEKEKSMAGNHIKPALSVRKNLEGEIERITKDPLARHKDQPQSTVKPKSEKSSKADKPPSAPKPTIPVEAYHEKLSKTNASSAAATSKPFSILSDVQDSKVESRSQDKQFKDLCGSNTSTAGKPFAIFSDAQETKVESKPKLEASAKKPLNISASASSKSFAIFSDEPVAKPESKPMHETAKKQPFAIFSDEDSRRKESPQRSSNHVANESEAELEEVMRNIGILNDEDDDRTINTKIAMKDIDSMFCSPIQSAEKSMIRTYDDVIGQPRRPFMHSNFESITGMPGDLSAIHEVRYLPLKYEYSSALKIYVLL
jgi:hypothetical protein